MGEFLQGCGSLSQLRGDEGSAVDSIFVPTDLSSKEKIALGEFLSTGNRHKYTFFDISVNCVH